MNGSEGIQAHLQQAAVHLCTFLNLVLPKLDATDWWLKLVLPALSFSQQREVTRRGISSLEKLDLAALLRILDQNWHRLSPLKNLSLEDRHFAKEMQTVRNRWAHATASDFERDDVFRDLDTLQRFCETVEAPEEFIRTLRKAKESTFLKASPEQTDVHTEVDCDFAVGQLVSRRSDPGAVGIVRQALPGKPETRYNVFIDNRLVTLYASQLQSAESKSSERPLTPLSEFHARLSAKQIGHPSLSSLYSLHSARIDFVPHQFRPVLKFIRAERPRLLIADGVGVGKTIEAGLILRELQARRDIKSILIICPKPLIVERKWELELKRFDEQFETLDGDRLRYCLRETDLDGVWPAHRAKAIIPFSLLDEDLLNGTRGRKGLLKLDPPPHFDLLIVDEAHHVRNPQTLAHQAVSFFCDNSDAVLFLTATPIQLGSEDLFVLLNLLRPDLIIDRPSFQHMAEPNPYINRAIGLARSQKAEWQQEARDELSAAAQTAWGRSIFQEDPEFQRTYDLLAEDRIKPEDRISLITSLEQMHTFSGVFNRTRRCDIENFTIRKPDTVEVPFTNEQQRFHDALLLVQAEILSRVHEDVNIKFLMTTIRRQAASCLFGLVPLLEDILTRHLDEIDVPELDERFDSPDMAGVSNIEDAISQLMAMARKLPEADPKLDALRRIIQDKQSLVNNKLMVFSCFRHTLAYLDEKFRGGSIRVGIIHGNTKDDDRIKVKARFQRPREDAEALDALFFSEVGCEGLDYQFCDCIVNYDLPWNPMRVDQRIGRIDRPGQQSESVAIYNLIVPGTVDADIYFRCLWRIGVFQNALGASEEILGQITREIRDVGENLSLTAAERQSKLDRLAENQIRRIQEEQQLEEKEAELFGIRVSRLLAEKEIQDASSHWLAPWAIQNLIESYLQNALGADQEYILSEKPLKTLRLSQENRSRLLKDFASLPKHTSKTYREWETWLKGAEQFLTLTFDGEQAKREPSAAFITPVHPFAVQASRALQEKSEIWTALAVNNGNIAPGDYPFAIYAWQFHGIREDLVLKAVSNTPAIIEDFVDLMKKSTSLCSDDIELPNDATFDDLEQVHYQLWLQARDSHVSKTRQMADFKKQSLKTSHQARVTALADQLANTTNQNIRRMRESQITSAGADYERRLAELETAIDRADLTSYPVAFGVIRIIPRNSE